MMSSAAVPPPVETEGRVFTGAASRPPTYSDFTVSSAAGPSAARRTLAPVSDGGSFSSSLSSSLPPSTGASSSRFPAGASSSSPSSTLHPYSTGARIREKDSIGGSASLVGATAASSAVRGPTGTAASASHRGGGAERSRMKTSSSILLPSRDKFQPAAGPLQYLQMRSAFLYTPSFVAPLPSVPLAPKLCAYTLKRSAICGATSAAAPALAVATAVHSRLGSSSANSGGSGHGRSSSSTGTAPGAAAAGDVTIFDVAASRQFLQTFDAAGLLLNLINPKGYPQLRAVPPPPGAPGTAAKNSDEHQNAAAAAAGKSAAAGTAAATPPPCVAALPAEDLELVAGVLPECALYMQQQRQQQLARHAGRGMPVDANAQQRRRGGAAAAAKFAISSNSEHQGAASSGGWAMQGGQAKGVQALAAGEGPEREAKGRALPSDTLHDQSIQAAAEYKHPTKPHLRPRRILTVVPSRQLCGNRYLQVGIDLPRNELDALAEDGEADSAAAAMPVAGEETQQQQPHLQQRAEQSVTEQQPQSGNQQEQHWVMKRKQAAPASLLLVNSSSLTHVSYAYYMKIGELEQPSRGARQLPSGSLHAAGAPEAKQQRPTTDEGHQEGPNNRGNSSSSKVTSKASGMMEARYRFARDYTCQISRKEGSYRGEKTFLLIIPRSTGSAALSPPASAGASVSSTSTGAAAFESAGAADSGKGKSAPLSNAAATPPRVTSTPRTAAGGAGAGRGGGTASTGYAYVVPLHSHKRILMKAGGCTRRSKVRLLMRQPSEKEREALAERRTAWLGGSASPSKAPQRSNGMEEEPLASAVTPAVGARSIPSATGGEEESSSGSVRKRNASNEEDSQETASQKEEAEAKSRRTGEEAATPGRRCRQPGRSRGDSDVIRKDSESASSSSSSSAKKQKTRASAAGRRAGDRSHSSSNAAAGSEEEEPQLFREDNGAGKEEQEEEEEEDEEEEEEEEEESSSSGSGSSSSSSKSDEDDD